MGKRSKMNKTGVPKVLLKKNNKNKAFLNINAKMNQTMNGNESSDEDKDEEPHTKMNKSMNQSVNYDQESLKKYGLILGLNEKEMESLAINPLRNRRMVNNVVLSRRQKRKALRQERKQKIEQMEYKTKLNLSMTSSKPRINNTVAAARKNNPTPVVSQKNQFNMNDLDKEIESLENKVSNKQTPSSKIRTKKRNMRMLNEEKTNIESVIQKSSFNQNPIEAMSMHIKTAQLVAERNKRMQEEYNKHYNMLNLK